MGDTKQTIGYLSCPWSGHRREVSARKALIPTGSVGIIGTIAYPVGMLDDDGVELGDLCLDGGAAAQ